MKKLEDYTIKEIRECCENYIKSEGPCTTFSCSCKFKDLCKEIDNYHTFKRINKKILEEHIEV